MVVKKIYRYTFLKNIRKRKYIYTIYIQVKETIRPQKLKL